MKTAAGKPQPLYSGSGILAAVLTIAFRFLPTLALGARAPDRADKKTSNIILC